MERSAVYRRALAPIMLFAGLTGLVTMVWDCALISIPAVDFADFGLGRRRWPLPAPFSSPGDRRLKTASRSGHRPRGGSPRLCCHLAGRIKLGTALLVFRPWNRAGGIIDLDFCFTVARFMPQGFSCREE